MASSSSMGADLGTVLAQLLVPVNETRRHAEERFKVLAKDPAVVPALLGFLHSSPEPPVRQMAAVLLRKRITVHWTRLGPEIQANAKAVLLEKIVVEPEAPVRRAAADVVGVIAKHAIPAGQWPDLLTFLMQCTQSQQAEHREVALVLFCSLAENLPEAMHSHFNTLHGIFQAGLQDSAPRVRSQAMRAVQALVELTQNDEDMKKVVALVAPVIAVCRACIQAGEEDTVLKAFEMFFEVVEMPSRILTPVVGSMVPFCLEVGKNTELDSGLRQQGMELVSQLAQSKPKQLVKSKLATPLVQTLCHMCTEPSEDDPDDDYVLCSHKVAAQTLDYVAQFIPAQHVLPPVLEFCSTALPSADPNHRRAGLSVLAVLAEGCQETMRKQMGTLLPPVVNLLGDANDEVRGMSAFCLSQFAAHLQPDILEHHQLVLAGLFNALSDPKLSVKERAMYAVEAFCEHLDQEVVPYMGPLMQALMAAVTENAKVEVQEMALSAACSIANAAGEAFAPYLGDLVPVLQQCMAQTSHEHLQIRAHATECLGILIAANGGRATLGPHVPMFMQTAIAGFQLDSSEIREYTHGFFSNTATALKKDFAEYLPHVVPLAFSSLNLDDGLIFDDGDDDENDEDKGGGIVEGVRAAVGDSDDEEDEGGQNLRIRTGILDEKASACHALGAYMGATLEGFAPYIETALPLLLKMSKYFHEDVRSPAMTALAHLVVAGLAAAPVDANGNAPDSIHTILQSVMPIFMESVDGDDDHDTVACALAGASEIVKAAGKTAMTAYLPGLLKCCTDILAGEALAQQAGNDSEDEDEDQDEEGASGSKNQIQEVLLEGVSELLPALCTVAGAEMVPHFQTLMPELLKYGAKHATDHQRSLVSATLVDSFKALGPACSPLIPSVMPFLLQEMKAHDSNNRRNAAFCAGVACHVGGAYTASFYEPILSHLHTMLANPGEDASAKDNAAGALARMLAANAAPLPVSEALQVLLGVLPLREDMEEADAVYTSLCLLLERRDAAMAQHAGSILKAFATAVLFDKTGGAAVLERIQSTLRPMAQEFPTQLDALMATLAADEQTAITGLIRG